VLSLPVHSNEFECLRQARSALLILNSKFKTAKAAGSGQPESDSGFRPLKIQNSLLPSAFCLLPSFNLLKLIG
jgi:hypothetical protein